VTEAIIHIHEDSWGMRNLYPAPALARASRDVTHAAEAGERNRDPSGVGWTDAYVIQEPTTSYLDLELPLAKASRALAGLMPRVRKFYATASAGFDPGRRDPDGSYEEDAHCYGLHRRCFIKLEPEGELIKRIWFDAMTDDAQELATLRTAILAIEGLARSAIADYWLDVAGAVADAEFLDRYFSKLAGADAD
jgi:hypothetical protein